MKIQFARTARVYDSEIGNHSARIDVAKSRYSVDELCYRIYITKNGKTTTLFFFEGAYEDLVNTLSEMRGASLDG